MTTNFNTTNNTTGFNVSSYVDDEFEFISDDELNLQKKLPYTSYASLNVNALSSIKFNVKNDWCKEHMPFFSGFVDTCDMLREAGSEIDFSSFCQRSLNRYVRHVNCDYGDDDIRSISDDDHDFHDKVTMLVYLNYKEYGKGSKTSDPIVVKGDFDYIDNTFEKLRKTLLQYNLTKGSKHLLCVIKNTYYSPIENPDIYRLVSTRTECKEFTVEDLISYEEDYDKYLNDNRNYYSDLLYIGNNRNLGSLTVLHIYFDDLDRDVINSFLKSEDTFAHEYIKYVLRFKYVTDAVELPSIFRKFDCSDFKDNINCITQNYAIDYSPCKFSNYVLKGEKCVKDNYVFALHTSCKVVKEYTKPIVMLPDEEY